MITSQDTLQVAIFQVPDLNRIVRVDGSGFVSLPLIGRVPVRGKSLLQAQEDIAARYGRSYLRSPQVTLSLVKSGQRVTVNGAVKGPTVLTLDGPLTLSMAIAQSGGFSEPANSDRVHVARPSGQQVEDFVFNLNDIQAGKAHKSDASWRRHCRGGRIQDEIGAQERQGYLAVCSRRRLFCPTLA